MKKNHRLILGIFAVAGTFMMASCHCQKNNSPEPATGKPQETSVLKSQEISTLNARRTTPRIEYFEKKKIEIDKQIQSASPKDSGKQQQLIERSRQYSDLIDTLLNTHQRSIVGGHEDHQMLFPYQAALAHKVDKDKLGPKAYFCSASFIDSTWLVTAAHCFGSIRKPGDFVVLSSISEDLVEAAKSPLSVEKFCIHEMYVPNQYGTLAQNDIALVKLSASRAVQAIKPIDKAADATLNGDTKATVSGWGDVQPDLSQPTQKLNVASANLVGNDVCMTDPNLSGLITDGMRCIDAGPPGPCTGDSGAPLVVQGSPPLLDGILSIGACDVTKYAVFTRVSADSIAKWINETRNSEKNCIDK